MTKTQFPAWQPIESAPKDGTYFLAVIEGFAPSVCAWQTYPDDWEIEPRWCDDLGVWFEEDAAAIEWLNSSQYAPTHWMPLPEPPT